MLKRSAKTSRFVVSHRVRLEPPKVLLCYKNIHAKLQTVLLSSCIHSHRSFRAKLGGILGSRAHGCTKSNVCQGNNFSSSHCDDTFMSSAKHIQANTFNGKVIVNVYMRTSGSRVQNFHVYASLRTFLGLFSGSAPES